MENGWLAPLSILNRSALSIGAPSMESPFPGMDPYLEAYWPEVHQRLVIYSGDTLQFELPELLRVRVQQRVFVESEESEYRAVYPDVHVVERGRPPAGSVPPESGIAVDVPLQVRLDHEPVTQSYIEIVDAASGNRVVTVIGTVLWPCSPIAQ
jgi:hypothetical protein